MSPVRASQTFANFLRDARFNQPDGVLDIDNNQIIELLQMTEQLLPDQVILLCNHSYLNLRYVSANAREILGYSSREFQALSLQEFFHTIHPEDVQAFQQCVNYINKLGEFDPAGYRCYACNSSAGLASKHVVLFPGPAGKAFRIQSVIPSY